MRVWIWAALAAAAVAGCGPQGGFPVAKTTGRVVCEGQPVPFALVFFEPLQGGEGALVGKQGLAIAKEDGTFSVSTYGDGDGAVIGKHRIRVDRPLAKDHPEFTCPCAFNSEVDIMQVEVKKGETNNFEVALKKRTGREPKPVQDD